MEDISLYNFEGTNLRKAQMKMVEILMYLCKFVKGTTSIIG
jgi:hypothetical protein